MGGGACVKVEIDESKFVKRKYNCGRHVVGEWVLGDMEHTSPRCFLRVVKKRHMDTRSPISYILRYWSHDDSIHRKNMWPVAMYQLTLEEFKYGR